MYECSIYDLGHSIFNIDGQEKRYRQNANEIQRITFTQNDVYENKKIIRCLIFFVNCDNSNPIINICFASFGSANKFIKANKTMMLNNFGKFGENYFCKICSFSHNIVECF